MRESYNQRYAFNSIPPCRPSPLRVLPQHSVLAPPVLHLAERCSRLHFLTNRYCNVYTPYYREQCTRVKGHFADGNVNVSICMKLKVRKNASGTAEYIRTDIANISLVIMFTACMCACVCVRADMHPRSVVDMCARVCARSCSFRFLIAVALLRRFDETSLRRRRVLQLLE
jgi:hypothetical protein